MIKVEVQKNLIGLEDILTGVGTVQQMRGKQLVTVTKINAQNFPFDEDVSLAEKAALIDAQYQYVVDRIPLLTDAVAAGTLLTQMSVHIDELRLWLTVGNNGISAFKPFVKSINQDETLAADLNHVMLEDTVIQPDVTITVGSNADIVVLKGEDFAP